ncbi:HvfC family RiPP maturation protein [Pseudomonas shirazensis]|uniref:HvfC family RiPP maturation protein n=1 Tax=Pseudomonas shirazensis TaxID=2745494 RepID=UPI003D2C4B27
MNLHEQQLQMASYVRDPLHNPPPADIEARRLRIYRELFYNSIEGLLAAGFPVMRATLGELPWHARVRDFYATYRSQTPLFTEVGGAFIDYLHNADLDAPWQLELAHYEWIEAQLFRADDAAFTEPDTADLLEGEPRLSCLARVLAYRWPVDQIGPGYQPSAPPAAPTLLLVYRDQHLQVRFARLTPMAYQLLAGLSGSGRQRLQALGDEQVQAQGLALLKDLHSQQLIIAVDYCAGALA